MPYRLNCWGGTVAIPFELSYTFTAAVATVAAFLAGAFFAAQRFFCSFGHLPRAAALTTRFLHLG